MLDRDGGGDVRDAERGAARRRAAGVDRRRRDRPAGRRRPGPTEAVRRWCRIPSCASGWARRRASAPAASPGSARRVRRSGARAGRRRPGGGLARGGGGSETVKAAGMATATLAANAIGLLFTVLFARILGATDYGRSPRSSRPSSSSRCPAPRCRSRWRARSRWAGWDRRAARGDPPPGGGDCGSGSALTVIAILARERSPS